MIQRVTPDTAAQFSALADEATCTGLQMAAAYACHADAKNAPAAFYLVDDTAALCVQGRHALLCGFVPQQEELAGFLAACGAESFCSETMLLDAPGWQPDAQLLMRFSGQYPDVFAVGTDAAPDLWKLAHSVLFEGKDGEAWYAEACARRNRGLADVRAAACEDAYVAIAAAWAVREAGVYLSCVETAADFRRQGYASTLLSGLCRRYGEGARPVWLFCRPPLRRFYEALGFVLEKPVCAWKRAESRGNAPPRTALL